MVINWTILFSVLGLGLTFATAYVKGSSHKQRKECGHQFDILMKFKDQQVGAMAIQETENKHIGSDIKDIKKDVKESNDKIIEIDKNIARILEHFNGHFQGRIKTRKGET